MSNETTTTKNQCCECRDGEHPDYDGDVRLVTVLDPDGGRGFVKRGKMCREHRQMYEGDGYRVKMA